MKLTGQDEQYIYSGGFEYGPEYIDDLIEQCLKENKKIVWKSEEEGWEEGLQTVILEKIR